jgi:AraC-like DNA-binding protein
MTIETITVTVTFACCAVAHFAGMVVMGILARHRVQYLSLVWMLAIFFVALVIVSMYGESVAKGVPGILHPYMLLVLVAGIFLQSIYSLGFALPGFLQVRRMCKYATPIILLAIVYMIAIFPAGRLTRVYSYGELFTGILSVDLVLRILALGLGVYYALNIIFLPRKMAQKTTFPVSIIAYTTVLIFSIILYMYTALDYSPLMLCAYMVMFTIVNYFWVCHSLESLMQKMPHPKIELDVSDDVGLIEVSGGDRQEDISMRDFNEMNHKRYMRVQLWMQTHKEAWLNNGFNRDKLCDETGINRQLMLQCLRSQGHNNIHEYITTYRVEELMRLIRQGEVTSVSDCILVGFVTPKTARACFERIAGSNLDDFLLRHKR